MQLDGTPPPHHAPGGEPGAGGRPHLLMCAPDHFDVQYVINPWMEGNIGRPDIARARAQWEALRAALARHAEVVVCPPAPGLPDMVFTANAGLVLNRRVILSAFAHPQRQPEEVHFAEWFRAHGFEVILPPEPYRFEGCGDAVFDTHRQLLWLGYGQRSSLEAHPFIAETMQIETVSLRLVDPRYYHLDVALCALPGGDVMYHPPAFDSPSLAEIERRVAPERRIPVSAGDAQAFACNAVALGEALVLHPISDGLRARLRERGHVTEEVDLSEFHRAGGSAFCLSLRLDHTHRPAAGAAEGLSAQAGRVIDLQGHLLNTGLMARVLDVITDNGGSFDILEFRAGQRPEDQSRARLRVTAPRPSQLEAIIEQIHARGGDADGVEQGGARLVAASKDGVAPADFHVTTIYPTEVLVDGQWVTAERQRMDAAIVVERPKGEPPRARCTLMRDVRRGDLVVCGFDGVRVKTPSASGHHDEFAFMSSGVSSERRVEIEVEKIAWEMRRIRERGGRTVVVAGPVVIHTGGGPHLAALIRAGHVQALLGGNAVAVHDMEQAVLGTSLGVDLRSGAVIEGGHRHHLRVINAIREHGSIAAAVRAGFIRGGVMHACVECGVPFVLAGSIRDDGPLPETVMDLVEAQRQYAEALRGADMVLMLSSMLHAIGVGNMTPSGVRLICVDINPAVVTKLADRGSLDAAGVVTDVGLFLAHLTAKLGITTAPEAPLLAG